MNIDLEPIATPSRGPVPRRGAALVRALGRPVLRRRRAARASSLGSGCPRSSRSEPSSRRARCGRGRAGAAAMSLVGIFIYGIVVFAIVASALALIAWGIVNERRDRIRHEQGREVFGDRAAASMHRADRKRRPDEPRRSRPHPRRRARLRRRSRATRGSATACAACAGRTRSPATSRAHGPGHRRQLRHRRGDLRGPARGRRQRALLGRDLERGGAGAIARIASRVPDARGRLEPEVCDVSGLSRRAPLRRALSGAPRPSSTSSSTTPACSPQRRQLTRRRRGADLRDQRPRPVPAHERCSCPRSRRGAGARHHRLLRRHVHGAP